MFYSFYKNAEFSIEDDLRYLKLFPDYEQMDNDKITEPKFTFDFNSTGIMKIRNEWKISDIMGSGTEIQRLVRLKNWAFDFLCFSGKKLESRPYEYLNCFDIIQSAKKRWIFIKL